MFFSVINANNLLVISDNTSCVKCTSPPPTSLASSKPNNLIKDIFSTVILTLLNCIYNNNTILQSSVFAPSFCNQIFSVSNECIWIWSSKMLWQCLGDIPAPLILSCECCEDLERFCLDWSKDNFPSREPLNAIDIKKDLSLDFRSHAWK